MKSIVYISLILVSLTSCVSTQRYNQIKDENIVLLKSIELMEENLKKEQLLAIDAAKKARISNKICNSKIELLYKKVATLENELKLKSDSIKLLSK